MPSHVLGFDVGGANLKLADSTGRAVTAPFPLWTKTPQELQAKLAELVATFPPADAWAATMTGELCDCFATKREGVETIVQAIVVIAGNKPLLFWQNDGTFVEAARAIADHQRTASANWLALATLVGQYCGPGPSLLIDIGSTTTDVIPIWERIPCPGGRTDAQRLLHKELLYLGATRTPFHAVLPKVRWRGRDVRLATEYFATMKDAYVLLGDLPEDAHDSDTADGRPATHSHAHARIARTLCADVAEVSLEEALAMATAARAEYLTELGNLTKSSGRHDPVQLWVAGSGSFLAPYLRGHLRTSSPPQRFDDVFGVEASRAACAFAVARLAADWLAKAPELPVVDAVVKVGGSLLDLPDLGARLQKWLARQPTGRYLLVAGGGAHADVIREQDRRFHLRADFAHDLAVRAMDLNARLLQTLLPHSTLVADRQALDQVPVGTIAILQPTAFLTERQAAPLVEQLPPSWDVTSDSIAAYLALRLRAKELVLLKSCSAPEDVNWADLANQGVVDRYFPTLAPRLPAVRLLNFREVS